MKKDHSFSISLAVKASPLVTIKCDNRLYFCDRRATFKLFSMYKYDTVSEAVNDLNVRGYTQEFTVKGNCLYCHTNEAQLRPDEFTIDEVYRFEGNTDPADESVIYAVSSTDGSMKGILVDAYGAYADTASEELVSKLQINRDQG
jgi:hypothetical protein